jgi:hypothetical protein
MIHRHRLIHLNYLMFQLMALQLILHHRLLQLLKIFLNLLM